MTSAGEPLPAPPASACPIEATPAPHKSDGVLLPGRGGARAASRLLSADWRGVLGVAFRDMVHHVAQHGADVTVADDVEDLAPPPFRLQQARGPQQAQMV